MSVAADGLSERERAAAQRDAAIRDAQIKSIIAKLESAPVTECEAAQVLPLYWFDLPAEAREMVIAVDVGEFPDEFDMEVVIASWTRVPTPQREWLWWHWLVYLLRVQLEVLCERSRAEHARVRADFRASGLRLRHDPRFDAPLAAEVPPRVRDRDPRPRRTRPRSSRRRPRAPPPGEDDPEPDGDVDDARPGGFYAS